MKKRLIVGGMIGLLLLAMTIINEFAKIDKKDKEVIITSVITTQVVPETTTTTTTTTTKKTTKRTTRKATNNTNGTYKVTHYGPDCRGCSGITASGYNVKNTIWYNDPQYGKIRIVATSKKFPLYSVIRLNNYKDGDFIAIVLDRGVSGNVIDVLVSSEKEATRLGIKKNVTIDLLRSGK